MKLKYFLILFFILLFFQKTNAGSGALNFNWVGNSESCVVPSWAKAVLTLDSATLATTNYIDWDFGDGSAHYKQQVANINDTVKHQYTSSGLFQITVTAILNNGRQGPSVNQPFFIGSPDKPSIGVNPAFSCNGKVLFSENSLNNGISIDKTRSIFWDFGDGSTLNITRNADSTSSITHNYIPTAKDSAYNVKMRITNQCGADSTTSTVQVINFNPKIAFVLPACKNIGIQFKSFGGPAGANYSYMWDFGDGTPKDYTASPTHNYSSFGSFPVTLNIDIAGDASCNRNIDTTIKVLDSPKTTFKLIYTPACDTATVSFTNTTTSSINISTYHWDFGNGDTSNLKNPPALKYAKSGSFSVNLTAKNDSGCSVSTSGNILIPATPNANFGASQVCQGALATFLDSSKISSGAITKWNWNFGNNNTSTLKNPTFIYNSGGAKTIKLLVASGSCVDSVQKVIIINPKPVAAFIPGLTTVCQNIPVNFTNTSTGASIYTWNFKNEAPISNINTSYIFKNNSLVTVTDTVQMIASTGSCSDTAKGIVHILPSPVATYISNINEQPSCGPNTYWFKSTIKGPAGTSIKWLVDDNLLSANDSISQVFTNTDIYVKRVKISMVASSAGCADTSVVKYVNLYPKPNTDYRIDTLQICPPARITFYAPSEKQNQYIWDFGNGKRVAINTSKYVDSLENNSPNNLTYNIKLISVNEFGCSDSTIKPFDVPGKPLADFATNPSVPIYFPNTGFAFNNTSLPSSNAQFSWNFGDNSTASIYSPPVHNYQKWGTYRVNLMVTNNYNCFDSISKVVKIIAPSGKADILADSIQGCPPLKIIFNDVSQYNDTAANTWEFGDGSSSKGTKPENTYNQSGTYKVVFTTKDFNDSILTDTVTIVVFANPSAEFAALPKSPIIPDDSVHCFPVYPAGGETYLWNFGDNSTSTLQKPVHLYTDTLDYSIVFTVWSAHKCRAQKSIEKAVKPLSLGTIVCPNAFMPLMSGPDDPHISESDLRNTIFAPFSSGVSEYTLEIYNRWGEKIFESNDKSVAWNGYFQNTICKQDVYVWKVSGVYSNKKTFVKTGTVTLLHSRK